MSTAETRTLRVVDGGVRDLISSAQGHWNGSQREMIQFAAELRQLQTARAHLSAGTRNFAAWAELEFDGLTACNVRQIVRAGGVALALEQRGRIDLASPAVGTTGLRALSAVQTKLGEAKMVEVFDVAAKLRPGRVVTGPDVTQACHLLMPPTDPDLGSDDGAYDIPDRPAPEDKSEPIDCERAEVIHDVQDRLWELLHAPKDDAIAMVRELQAVFDELLELLTKTTPVEAPRALLPGPAVTVGVGTDEMLERSA